MEKIQSCCRLGLFLVGYRFFNEFSWEITVAEGFALKRHTHNHSETDVVVDLGVATKTRRNHLDVTRPDHLLRWSKLPKKKPWTNHSPCSLPRGIQAYTFSGKWNINFFFSEFSDDCTDCTWLYYRLYNYTWWFIPLSKWVSLPQL